MNLPSLPDGWHWAPVKEVVADEPRALTDGPFGSNLKTEHYTDSGPRVIRLQNIGERRFLDAEAHISEEHFAMLERHEAKAGDIVLASLGERLPRACLVPEDLGPAIVKADCPRLRPRANMNPEYLVLALNSEPVRAQARSVIHGLGRPRLKLAALKQLMLPLPPRAEQDAIVTTVRHFDERVLDGLKHFSMAQDGLEAYIRSAMHALLDSAEASGFEAWSSTTLGAVAQLSSGGTPSRQRKDFFDGGIPWLKIGELNEGTVLTTEETITDAGLASMSAGVLPVGTVLLAMYGASIGRLGILGIPAATNQAICAFQVDEALVERQFLFHFLMYKKPQFVEAGYGGAQPNISQKLLRDFPIHLPPLDEQQKVVAMLETQLASYRGLLDAVKKSYLQAASLEAAVLRDACLGRLTRTSSNASTTPDLRAVLGGAYS